MAVYKDKKRGTWYVSFYYKDWTGQSRRKIKRGFRTKREAAEWELHFQMRESADLDMTFGDFWKLYEADVRPKLKENTWNTKEIIVRSRILPFFEEKKMNESDSRCMLTDTQSIGEVKE